MSVVAIATALIASSVASEERTTAGLASMSCSDVVMFKDSEIAQRAITDWAEGFATGLNFGLSVGSKKEYNLGDPAFSNKALHPRILAACYVETDEPLMGIVLKLILALPIVQSE